MAKKRLNNITILRFIAALYVFLFHANSHIHLELPWPINWLLANGATGMSIFFILSGFILTYNHGHTVGDGYFKKRIRRIYPAYLFCGILTIPFLINEAGGGYYALIKIISTAFLFLTSTQSWITPSFQFWNFNGTWSVSTEMFFYICFPLLLKLVNEKNIHVISAVAMAFCALIIPLSLVYQSDITMPFYYATPIYRLPEFIAGICAAKYMERGLKVNASTAVILTFIMLYTLSYPVKGYMQYNFIIVPCVALILIFLSNASSPWFFRPFVWMGEISYSFYLMQCAGFMIAGYYKPKLIYDNGIIGWLILFIIFTCMAQISYSLFEKRNFFSYEFWKSKNEIS